MPHFKKPAEGSWTEHLKIGTEPVSYEDSISPEQYEREREAIFKRTWLNVGRVEQLPRKGSYFTKELDAARTSVVVVRGTDGEVRAFHNVCRHRGNKLVWNDFPREETSGVCRQFTCKYHAWRYDLDGKLAFVQQEGEFFDLDKAAYGLKQVRTEVWEGFVFVNLDPENTTPLREYLGSSPKGSRAIRSTSSLKCTSTARRSAVTGSCSSTRSPSSTTRRSCTPASTWPRRPARSRNTATRRCTTTSTARTAWCPPGAVSPLRTTARWSNPSKPPCTAGCSGRGTRPTSGWPRRICRPRSIRAGTSDGAWTRSSSSPTSCC